jgi:hypothetical protein
MSDYQEDPNALIPSDTDDEEPMSMTLSGIGRGDDAGDPGYEGMGDAGGGGLLSHTTLLIVAVAVVAVGSLYLMRATQGDLSASKEVQAIEAKIATTLNRLNAPSLLPDGDPLLAENLSALLTPTEDAASIFEHDVRDQQVPIEQVKKDPFSLAMGDNTLESAGVNNAVEELDRRLAKYRSEMSKFDLQSIMLGSRNIAVIDGEFYKVGDLLGSFRITAIEKLTVYLEAGGETFELTLQESGL